ncbi:MAG: protein kinase [Pseudomonadota bacterium]
METRTFLRKLELPYASLKTLYEGNSEVRLYRNDLTGAEQIGKRICTLGLEATLAVQEATLLQTVRHDNLVPVSDVAVVNAPADYPPPMRVIELIMPFYPRGSLFDALHKGTRFSVRDACLHAQAVLRGLGELHEQHGILHRDLKSANVFLTEDTTLLRVGDLGAAMRLDLDGTAEAYPSVQPCTAPETYTVKRLDRRADIYGVGLILFELLHGPFEYSHYDSNVGAMNQRLAKGRSALRQEDLAPGPHVPPRLRAVLKKATSRKLGERYATCRAMSEAIARAPLIDWRSEAGDDDALLWEGASVQRPDRRFRIEAKRRRGGRWSLSGLQYVTRWQRFVPDVLVAQPTGPEATAFFDQVVKAALRR